MSAGVTGPSLHGVNGPVGSIGDEDGDATDVPRSDETNVANM